MKRALILPVLMGCLTAVMFAQASVTTLVPARSVAVIRVDWTKVRKDSRLREILNGDEFAKILESIGINEAAVREFAIFSDVSPTSNNKMGVIVRGNFTSESIAKNLSGKDWTTEKIGTRSAFINPADGSRFLNLRNGLLVAGTKTAVEQVAGVLTNPKNALIRRKNFRTVMAGLGSTSPVSFFLGVPEEYRGAANFAHKIATKLMSFADFGILSTIFEKVGLIQSCGMSINAAGRGIPIHLIVEMPGTTQAYVASGTLNFLKSGASMLADADPNKAAAQSMIIASKGNLLSIKMNLPDRVISR